MFYFDPMYFIFMIPAFIIMALASWYVRSSYNKWSQVRATSGLTGAQAAQREALILISAEAPLPYGILLLGQTTAAGLDNRHGAQLLGFLGSSLAAMIRRCLIDS